MLIEDMEYQDTMVVKRNAKDSSGEILLDDFGNQVYDIVFEGKCDYQVSVGQTKLGGEMYLTEPTVFFPLTEAEFRQDDIVDIITHFGRSINGVIRNYDKVEFLKIHQSVIYLRIVKDGEA